MGRIRTLGPKSERLDLERRLERCFEERSSLRLEGEELYGQFLTSGVALDEARSQARKGRLDLAAEALQEHFHERIRPLFFLHYSEAPLLKPRLEEHPADCRALLHETEGLLAHRFTPLGVEPYTFTGTIDWFSDFQDRSWVCAHVADLRDQFAGRRPMPAVEMGSIEVTWEFNRHPHFVQLGRAYWLTGNERFASEFIVQVVDWSERNRALEGVNWLDPATVAARCTNWLLALHMFLGSEQLTPDLLARILSSLITHGAVLAHYVRESDNLAAASGLYTLALSMPELRLSKRWLALAGPALARGAALELGRDGLHRSGSVARHRLATEWLLLPLALHLLNGSQPPAGLAEAAAAALEALSHLRSPSGLVAELGPSSSPGFLGALCGASEHTRRLLALGALTLRRGELRLGIPEMPGELYWWYGPKAAENFYNLRTFEPGTGRRLFAEVGIATARDRWEGRANWCVLRGTPSPSGYEDDRFLPPAEAEAGVWHDDFLSFVLTLEGEPVLIEPGMPRQHPAGAGLKRLQCHSAARLPGEVEPLLNRSLPEGHPAGRDLRMEEWETGLHLSATRQVWAPGAPEPWAMRRDVLFQPARKTVILRDHVDGVGEGVVETNLLLAPHLDILMRGDMGCLVRGKRLHARINPLFPARFRYNQSRGETNPFAGWYHGETQKVQPTTRLRYFTRLTLPTSVYVWISWDPREPAVPRAKDIDLLFETRGRG